MKKIKVGLLLTIVAILSGLIACNPNKKKEKITDIPVTTSSKDALKLFRDGLVFYDQGDYLKSRDLFDKATQKDPKIAVAYLLQLSADNTPREVIDALEKAKENVEGASYWEKMYYNLFVTYVTNNWDKRMEIVKKIDSAYPDAPRAKVDLGTVYQDGNNIDQSRSCFSKALQMDSAWAGSYSAIVYSYLFYEPKNLKKAESYAQKLVKLSPKSAGAEIVMGDCYRAEDDLLKARDAYAKAIQLDPTFPISYYKKGHANTFLGKYEEARQDYAQGGKHDLTPAGGDIYIGNTYLCTGNYKKALDYLTSQAKMLDKSKLSEEKKSLARYNYYSNCFLIAFHNGDKKTVQDMIVRLEPLSVWMGKEIGKKEEVLNQKAYILYLKSLQNAMSGKLDAAKARAEEIKTTVEPIENPNKLSNYEMAMGYICMQGKKYDDAVAHFEKAQQTQIYNKYWLAMAYEKAKKEDQAIGLFKEISMYNFNDPGYALIKKEVNELLKKESGGNKK
ncbi:MAG: tetratricopeptide repeat protein [Bacteroidota bacterium]|nr:tetratricopeptide repeat protein [Bacteroidota bacterium]